MLHFALAIISAVALISNISAIWVLAKKLKQGKTHSSHYILNLACADLIFSTCIFVVSIIKITELKVHHASLLAYWNISQGVTFTSSLLLIMLIAFDRLVGIQASNKAQKLHINPLKMHLLIAVTWILSTVIASTQFWLPLIAIDIIVCVIILIGLLSTASIYIIIGNTIRKDKSTANFNRIQRRQRSEENKRTIWLCALLTLAYFLCMLPFVFANLYFDISGTEWTLNAALTIYLLLTLKCVIDAILYTFYGIIMNLVKKNTQQRIMQQIMPFIIRKQ